MGKISTESGIKVLDRAVTILLALADHPMSLNELCEFTGLPRATAHRLATALEVHNILTRTNDGRWTIGAVLASLGASSQTKLIDVATPIMSTLMHTTNESVQLYQLAGAVRVCIAAQEPAMGLQNTVPVGTRLPLSAGSAARIFLAYSSAHLRDAVLSEGTKFSQADLREAREQGWAASMSEREVGLASVSAPVFDSEGTFCAVLSISGPAERLKPSPGKWADELVAAANRLSAQL
ncbi:IclR family transcriptional regulator [Corynebacterium pseudopelargi]|uniref:HTH-type transcriptional regulator KipR n=1 Tax=Corynebacterium pseudopelargi TaxID=2080757 RepID=A0A3G6IUI7_9CORY|nr:IclR family transcriptional regulator [Corynebacterium pseudopelargi]AZA09409.1 HTH-type transcriptional regulator KipR [Corynebacterium pseudopelargi]